MTEPATGPVRGSGAPREPDAGVPPEVVHAAVPGVRGLSQVAGETFSVADAVGGVRGLVESVLPVVVFSATYAVTRALWPSVIAALSVAVVLLVVRVVTRAPVTPAVSGVVGIGLGAGVALLTGRAIDFFLLSIVKNAAFALLYAGSIAVRWPLIGVLLGFFLGEHTHWREVPQRYRVYVWATWVWVGMFALRLAFQVPLFRHGRVAALGAAAVPLGLPLYGLVLGLTWLIVRRVPVARPPETAEPEPVSGDAPG